MRTERGVRWSNTYPHCAAPSTSARSSVYTTTRLSGQTHYTTHYTILTTGDALTWRGGVVVERVAHLLGYDGVADGQHGEELPDDGRRGVVALQVLVQQRVLQLLVGALQRVYYLRQTSLVQTTDMVRPRTTSCRAIHYLSNAALAELHDVAGEGAGLVAEDVLDHAELLVQVGGAGHGGGVRGRVVHLTVHRYELRLQTTKTSNIANINYFIYLFCNNKWAILT